MQLCTATGCSVSPAGEPPHGGCLHGRVSVVLLDIWHVWTWVPHAPACGGRCGWHTGLPSGTDGDSSLSPVALSEAVFPPPEHSCGGPSTWLCGPHRGWARPPPGPQVFLATARTPGRLSPGLMWACDVGSRGASGACKQVKSLLCRRDCRVRVLALTLASSVTSGLSLPICKWA